MTDTVYRLHPLSWVFHSWHAIRKIVFPLLLAALLGHQSEEWRFYLLVPMLLLVAYAYLSARLYRYQFGDGELLIREGLFNKRQRHIPFARIQSVSQRHKLLHRLLGVTEVQLDSAAGGRPEAVMKVLSLPAAAALEDLLRHTGTRPQHKAAVPDPAAPLFSMPPAEIVRFGLVSNRGAVVVGVGMGALMHEKTTRDLTLNTVSQLPINAPIRDFISFQLAQGHWLNLALVGLMAFAVAFVVFRILSVGLAFMRYYGFALERHADRLMVSHGLSTKVRSGARMQRLQRFVLQESWLHRRFSRCRLAVDVVGGQGHESKSTEASAKFTELAPIATRAQADALLRVCLPELDWNSLDWKPLHPKALTRRMVVLARWVLPLMLGLAWVDYLYQWRVPVLDLAIQYAIAGVVMVLYAQAWLRFAAVAESGDLLLFRSGVVQRNWVIVHASRLQNVRLVSTALDRSLGLVHLEGDIQGGPRNKRALVIPCMAREDGEQLRERLWQRIV
jgi:putative membrane protein